MMLSSRVIISGIFCKNLFNYRRKYGETYKQVIMEIIPAENSAANVFSCFPSQTTWNFPQFYQSQQALSEKFLQL